MRNAILALVFGVVAACGGKDPNDHSDETDATLVLDPATVELTIPNGMPVSQPYTAKLVFPDGFEKDVTTEVYFSIDSAFGTFSANTASVHTPGKTEVFGQRADKIGTAQLLARVKIERIDPTLPMDTPDLFDGAEDAARAPDVLYPPADVVMPRNLGDFETHWTDSHGNDIFEVSLKTEFADLRVYVPGGNGLPATGPMASWAAFLPVEWTQVIGVENAVTYQVRGVERANPGPVGAGPPRVVKLTNEEMMGGIYYWAAAAQNGAYGIYRHDMAKPGEPAEEFMTTNQTAGRCVACHVISRDGTRMAITYDGGDRNGTVVDVATKAAQLDTTQWNFATFTPDGTKLMTVLGGTLVVRDSATQAVQATMSSQGAVSHPDLSADGTRLVYAIRSGGADYGFDGGRIFTRSYDPATNAFGAETPLVADGVNNFYPSWSPDGQWVLFNRSDTGNSYNNGNASLWVVKSDGSAPPVQLAAANQGLGLTNSWGRWAPFQQSLGANGDPIFWVTVSSKRQFGTRLEAGTPQIWMTPFRVGQAAAGQDPSVSAFRLPFQNITSSNHIAQWTERVITTQ